MLILIGLILLGAWLFYKYYISIYDSHWEKRCIPSYPSKFPFGSDPNLITLRKFRGQVLQKMYNEMANCPLFGIFSMRAPMLVIRDLELINLILTKEFSHFRERINFKFNEKDVLAHNLFNLDGERWRALRVKLTPTFTSGKLKAMFPLFLNSAEAYDNLLMSKVDSELDIKELSGRLTIDIICSCAFGLETNTINNPEHKLRKIGIEAFKINLLTLLKFAVIRVVPQLFKLLGKRFNPVEREEYIVNLVKTTLEYREKNGIKRNDFLDLLNQLRNKGYVGEDMNSEIEEKGCQPFELTVGLIAAQCFIFFAAGFEASSSIQTYCLYELALHQDIQTRLREDIKKSIERNRGITYEAIKDMSYLEMVLSETTRKYPTLHALIRRCTKSLTTSEGYKIESGDSIIIPTWSIHHDPNYFPDPEKFDPERFSAENRHLIRPFSYLPFGEGPRMCIGMRFGQLQTKVGIITMLRKYKVEPCGRTMIPLEFVGSAAVTSAKVPIILKLSAISKT